MKAPPPTVPTDHLWCLRFGVSTHATARCNTNDPQVHFPPDDDSTKRGCLYCGLHGHEMSQCLRRVPIIQGEHNTKMQTLSSEQESQGTAIQQLQKDVRALQASQNIINECRADLTTLHSKVDTLMAWKNDAEPSVEKIIKLEHDFQHFLYKHWSEHRASYESFITKEWTPIKSRFQELLRENNTEYVVESDTSPDIRRDRDDDDDLLMDAARTTGSKRSGAGRAEPPSTPAKKRVSSGSATRKWWLDLDPLPENKKVSAWHSNILDALLSEWTDANMMRLQQWTAIHGTDEMRATVDGLSTSNTTKRSLHQGLKTVLRGAAVPPLVFSAQPPARTPGPSSRLNL